MNKPPPEVDNAKVLYWAWSGSVPFGLLKSTDGQLVIEIYGLAICQYANSNTVNRFSCDRNWETESDFDYDSVEEAMAELPEQYKNVKAEWIRFE